ncbi:MAG: C45 family peptidase [Rikenellaceae bacterium]|nr:C45 family peptidase [Rikenellaceae bacterium]
MRAACKIVRYLAALVLSLIALIFVGAAGLYISADRSIPVKDSYVIGQCMTSDSVTTYDSSYLRPAKSGLWELYLKGGPEERGAAIGQLCRSLMYKQEKAFVDQIYEMIPSKRYVDFLKYLTVIYNRNLQRDIPLEFRKEIYMSSLGCSHDFDFVGNAYERQLNYHAAHDIGHVMQEYMLVGCSSFAVWGAQSEDSSLIVARNFDFYVGDKFAEEKMVSFYFPDKGYKFASVGWAGMTGVLSGMNEKGLTVTINAAKSTPPLSSKTPISIITRNILQYACDINQAYEIASSMKSFVSESILIGSASDGIAAIIEKSPQSTELYTESGDRIISTNHFLSQKNNSELSEEQKKKLEVGHSMYRYRRLTELLNAEKKITPLKAAGILRNPYGLGNKPIGWTNEKSLNQFIAHHAVIFQPERLFMWVSTSPWQLGQMVAYDLGLIFGKKTELYDKHMIPEDIPADSLLLKNVYPEVLEYRKLSATVRKAIKDKTIVEKSILERLITLNPDYDYTYTLLEEYKKATEKK